MFMLSSIVNLILLNISINSCFIDMFAKLKELWADKGWKINEFKTLDCSSNSKLNGILDSILSQTNFKGSKVYLLKRIQKLISIQKFSVREVKLLKKLVETQLIGETINFKQIEYFFPGKNQIIVRKQVGKLLISL